jgi:hypothetical protein
VKNIIHDARSSPLSAAQSKISRANAKDAALMQQYLMDVDLNLLNMASLEAAINKARGLLIVMPSGAIEAKQLHVEIAVLAGLYGKMIYYKQSQIPMELLTDTEQITLLNWIIQA